MDLADVPIPAKRIAARVLVIRGQKVILDADLAEVYGVTTKHLVQAVKRNADRFPDDLAFELTAVEWRILRSQIVTSSCRPDAWPDGRHPPPRDQLRGEGRACSSARASVPRTASSPLRYPGRS